jgi:hypothetical protein
MYIDYDIPRYNSSIYEFVPKFMRTFPEHAAFKLHEGKAALKRVVCAVSYWNPAIGIFLSLEHYPSHCLGYCQSMANIIALLLMLTDEVSLYPASLRARLIFRKELFAWLLF